MVIREEFICIINMIQILEAYLFLQIKINQVLFFYLKPLIWILKFHRPPHFWIIYVNECVCMSQRMNRIYKTIIEKEFLLFFNFLLHAYAFIASSIDLNQIVTKTS